VGHKPSLTSEERLEIVEVLRKGNLSHREIAARFNRAQSTISKIARDVGLRPSHRRKRTPAAVDVEGTYNDEERINFCDRIIGALDGMVSNGGLTPRDMKELTTAAKAALDARRAEDVEPEKDERADRAWVKDGVLGDMAFDPNTYIGREILKLDRELEQEGSSEAE
jgi:hypothetical protein